ncbi:Oidioi.mRNA.OKI2018_I69.chr2.g8439.t1.cds [Oikopleura dioica]|uniref:Oidioi.mRNA.OKI2018_I69.chr2.g8439.t1.cds n=1 Tax=Oikopleura dioica TaxID=34765 RepID=A0ABN7T977_OIKDI|nr:Oidioi.mRNA.OKI2018_I69.chr2.g8439.t1.cds [Oikopleura dioica]
MGLIKTTCNELVRLYWSSRCVRLVFALIQICAVTIISFTIQCQLDGIPIFTEISIFDLLRFVAEYHLRSVKNFLFQVRYWSYYNEDGLLVVNVPSSLPRMC